MASSPSLTVLASLQAPDPTTPAQEIYTSQIAHRTLNLRATSPDPTSQTSRSIRRKKRLSTHTRKLSKQRPRKLSAKEKRTLGVYDLELAPGGRKTVASWDVWKGLWRLWCGYVLEVMGDVRAGGLTAAAMGPKVGSLDLHGAMVRVVKAECSSLVGIWGVVVRESKFGVVLVDRVCCVRRVGKKGVVFRVEVPLGDGEEDGKGVDLDEFLDGKVPRVVFEISGSALLCRPADRATKKFKGRKYDGL